MLRHTISFSAAFTIITFLHIVLGELAPKTLALERAERVALAISRPMDAFYRVFYWPIRLLDYAGKRTVRLFGLHASGAHASVYTEEELRRLVDISLTSGHLGPEQRQLLHRVFEFAEVGVREAMIPRAQVMAASITATLDEVRTLFLATGFSRLPVYRDRSDNFIGVVYRKDLDMGQVQHQGFVLAELLRQPVYFPETASAGEALKQMQASRVHFGFVLNEHGGIEGILTLEDLLEEIVGEINDEYDREVKEQIVAQQGSYVLDGMLAVRNANQQLGLELPEDEGYTTIAGFLMARAGRMLHVGDTVEYRGAAFKIERVDGWRIRLVHFTPATIESVSKGTLAPLVFAFLARP
jgi:CBS domain containing-hemolysin-like protein